MRERDLEIRRRERASGALGPFDNACAAAVEVVTESCVIPFLWALESIKIKVV
jgi:hypothetical protein